MKNLALLQVTAELLIQALHLPENTVIEDVRMDFKVPGLLIFRISHPDLSAVADGQEIGLVKAQFISHLHECGHCTVEFKEFTEGFKWSRA